MEGVYPKDNSTVILSPENVFLGERQGTLSLSAFQEKLKKAYQKKEQDIERVFSSPSTKKRISIGECFVNLSIVREVQQQQSEQQAFTTIKQAEPTESNIYYEEVFSTKKKDHFHSEDLLQLRDRDKPLRLLVLGRPGIGKSTLCQRLAYY